MPVIFDKSAKLLSLHAKSTFLQNLYASFINTIILHFSNLSLKRYINLEKVIDKYSYGYNNTNMMYSNEDNFVKLTLQLSKSERDIAKTIAREKGMTFAGWLGNLVRKELQNNAPDETIMESVEGQSVSYGDRRTAE